MWLVLAFGYGNPQHRAVVKVNFFELNRHGRVAVKAGSQLYHVFFFIGIYAAYTAVVVYPDQDGAAAGVGKGNKGTGYFIGRGDFPFEINLVVFALEDESVKFCHHEGRLGKGAALRRLIVRVYACFG